MLKILKDLEKKNNLFWVVLIIIFCVPATLPLLRSGFFHFSDEPHIVNLYEMYRAFSSGQIPPRWAPDMVYGYGYPLFNFYYVLPYYLGSLAYIFTNSLILSIKFLFFLTIPASAIGMYLWLRKHTDKIASFAGAVLYVYTPYRAVDLYVRGALGENFSLMIAPYVALSIYNVFERKNKKALGLLGIIIAAFILGHNLAPLMFLPWFALYAVGISVLFKDFKALIKVLFGVILGLGISAYWWVPALFEKGLLRIQTPFYYKDHFPFIKQLLYSPFEYGASNPGIGDDISFQLGLVNWFLIFLTGIMFIQTLRKSWNFTTGIKRASEQALRVFARRPGFLTLKTLAVFNPRLFINSKNKYKNIYPVFIGGIIVSIYLMNIRSSFFWDSLSLSTYVQFPWRFLMLTTFLTTSLVIFIENFKYRFVFLIFLVLFSIILTISYFRPSEYFYPDDNYYLNKMLPEIMLEEGHYVRSSEYKNYSEDYLLLPEWVLARPTSDSNGFTSRSEGLKILIRDERCSINQYADTLGSGILSFEHTYFPGWYAKINGEPAEIKIIAPYGNMGLDIRNVNSSINIYWKETPLRLAGDIVSLLSLLIFFGLVSMRAKTGK